MTTEEHLDRIKSRCRELLALAEKRTPGKWQADPEEGVYNASIRCGVSEPWTGNCVASVLKESDAAFIAACAGSAEAGWKTTIAAIEILNGMSPQVRDAMESAILAAWPEELLR